ncbi:MAG: FHA domain-containing serine/threonine-protein kinase [Thermoleophilaceae bacterium]
MGGEQLRVAEGNARGERVKVEADLLIGRAAAEDEGRLGDDPEISRRHARVSRGANGLLTIEDLGSANGTFVNDERIDAPRTLDLGDVVRVGRTVLQVTDDSGGVPEQTRLRSGVSADEPASGAAGAGEQLLVTDGTAKGRRLTLSDEFVIGRAASGDGRLGDDPELSRRHARVTRDAGGQLTIEDLGSANGTLVNGERVSERRALNVGDSVRVGGTTLELTEPEQEAPAPEPEQEPPAPEPEQEPPPPAPEPTADREKVAAELPLGSVFAGCRVEEVIGRGEMGIVYRAEELALQRRVALKHILPEYSQEARFRKRFRRESKVVASIDHPNVIPLLEAGDEDGVLFITMRLVEGTDLRALIAAEGRIDPLRAARIVRKVGAALDAAHARGLVHRDVKPANVLLARADHVYLSDFGLAKDVSSTGGLTRQGTVLAAAGYVAPEQITNDRVDARTDVYALGCLLFEALTGEAPFAKRKGGPAMLAALDDPPPSPVERFPDLPRQFDEVVRRAMAKQPGERYPSVGDVDEAALAAAGGRRRASAESVVATGEAAPDARGPQLSTPPRSDDETAETLATDASPASEVLAPDAEGAEAERPRDTRPTGLGTGGSDALRWGVALAVLAILAVAMIVALGALAKL